jgi:dTDP-4-amino-4,6-dideoxygalactose transaminase
MPVAFVNSDQRGRVKRSFGDRVEVRTYYEPLHEMPVFRHWPTVGGGLQQTTGLHDRILCLPMANDLTEREQEVIASVLRSAHTAERIGANATRSSSA